jgi:hypothetical protein
MGKYKQWLHHQEVGRRLREQIATYEQERERVQRMAPSHPTTLPDTSNPLVRALLDYTGRGGTLGRAAGARLSGTPSSGSDADPQQPRPAELTGGAATSMPAAPQPPTGPQFVKQVPAAPAAAASDDPIAAQLAARAAEMPADPLDAMRALAQSQSRDTQGQPPASTRPGQAPPNAPAAPEGNTTGEWWQRFRT